MLWKPNRAGDEGPNRTAWRESVTLRPAAPSDRVSLERLAQLDSRSLPTGPHLIAERERRVDAALSLSTGGVVADPFRHTAEPCELLRTRSSTHSARDGSEGSPIVAPSRLATA